MRIILHNLNLKKLTICVGPVFDIVFTNSKIMRQRKLRKSAEEVLTRYFSCFNNESLKKNTLIKTDQFMITCKKEITFHLFASPSEFQTVIDDKDRIRFLSEGVESLILALNDLSSSHEVGLIFEDVHDEERIIMNYITNNLKSPTYMVR